MNTFTDYIGRAANQLTGNVPGLMMIRGASSYENIVWNMDLKPEGVTIPTEYEITNTAKQLLADEAMNRLRIHRDILLSKCDWTQGADSPLSDESKASWATYRQQLRNLPSTAEPTLDGPFISNVDWPVPPQ